MLFKHKTDISWIAFNVESDYNYQVTMRQGLNYMLNDFNLSHIIIKLMVLGLAKL